MGFTVTLPPFGPFGRRSFAYDCEPTDMLGNTRFIDGNGDGKIAWDIGAFEFNSFKPPRFSGYAQLTTNGWVLNVTGPTNKWARVQRSGNLKDWGVLSGFCASVDDA